MAPAGASGPQADAAGRERAAGRLEIRVSSDSSFLQRRLPIEIRDSDQQLVEALRGDRPAVALAPGLYSVSAVLEDGAVHQRHVHIQPGTTERVEFTPREAAPLAFSVAEEGVILRGGVRGIGDGGAAGDEAVVVEPVGGAREVSRQDGRWVFAPRGGLESVPFARVTTPSERFEVSLPVNPQGHYPLNSCEVEARPGRRSLRLRVRLAPERRVASALERMVESGHVAHSAAVAQEAMELLSQKYQDPVGAAFGGLLLHRLGRLEARSRWLERLARSFPWLPDGQVLFAALLARSDDGDERRRGLDLLLAAAPRRMMFADGLSLALDLLRRWPDKSRPEERQRLLGEISPVAARARWHATVLTVKKE